MSTSALCYATLPGPFNAIKSAAINHTCINSTGFLRPHVRPHEVQLSSPWTDTCPDATRCDRM